MTHHCRESARSALAILSRLLWQNLFFILAVLLAAGTLFTSQGADLLQLAHKPSFSGRLLSLYAPLAFGGMLIAMGSFVMAAMDANNINHLARRGQFQTKARVLIFVVVPIGLGSTPALIACWRSGFIDVCILAIAIIAILGAGFTYAITRQPAVSFGVSWLSRKRFTWLTLFILLITAITFNELLPLEHARAVGTLGILLLVGALWALVLSCLFIGMPTAYDLPSLVLVPLIVFLLAGFYLDPNVFPHMHSTPTRFPDAPGQWTLVERRPAYWSELDEWCKQFTAVPKNERIPLYLVSAEGGGIRAAYWSAVVLAELDSKTKGEFRKHVFALSGVSGGSLGIATFATAAMRNKVKPDELAPLFRRYFANDFLSPLIAHLMIAEPLRVIFGEWSHVESRDRAFEEALAQDWKLVSGNDDFSRPFLETFCTNYRDCSEHFFPVIWFNSTIVETGLRGVISNISVYPLAPTASDLLASDLVARRNLDRITVAEAVHLSARFPFISPPATILADVAVDANDPNHHEKRLWGHLVDGGYLDNSAADNFFQLVDDIENTRKFALDCYSRRNSDCYADEIMDVERRLQIIVITLRNDPLDRGIRVFEIPTLITLNPDSIVAASTSPSGYLKDDFLASHLPSALKSEELVGPPAALAATREARGAVTRQTLATTMAETSHNSFVESCRRHLAGAASRRRGVSTSDLVDVGFTVLEAERILKIRAEQCDDEHRRDILDVACELRPDFYREYSLSEFLGDDRNISDCKSLGEGGLRGIALGWTLSSGVQDRLACIARNVQPPMLISNVGIGGPTCRQ